MSRKVVIASACRTAIGKMGGSIQHSTRLTWDQSLSKKH